MAMSQAELIKALVDAGVHFGHQRQSLEPQDGAVHPRQAQPDSYSRRPRDPQGHPPCRKLVQQVVASGKDVLFVGSKRQARHAIEDEARRCGMHFVSERWLGGTLTNFRTIRSRLQRLEELEKLFETGEIETYSKKMKSTLKREMDKIKTNLDGIRKMDKMPGIMFLVDVRREHIAVKEAKQDGRAHRSRLSIPTVIRTRSICPFPATMMPCAPSRSSSRNWPTPPSKASRTVALKG